MSSLLKTLIETDSTPLSTGANYQSSQRMLSHNTPPIPRLLMEPPSTQPAPYDSGDVMPNLEPACRSEEEHISDPSPPIPSIRNFAPTIHRPSVICQVSPSGETERKNPKSRVRTVSEAVTKAKRVRKGITRKTAKKLVQKAVEQPESVSLPSNGIPIPSTLALPGVRRLFHNPQPTVPPVMPHPPQFHEYAYDHYHQYLNYYPQDPIPSETSEASQKSYVIL